MSDKVIVVLDRDAAEVLVGRGWDRAADESADSVRALRECSPAICAALGRDPDALIEQVAEAIDPKAFDTDGNGVFLWSSMHRWEARGKAEAAIAAITGKEKA